MLACFVSSLILATVSAQGPQPGLVREFGGVPWPLMSKLNRGANITRWFGYVHPEDTKTFRDYLVPADFQNFRKLGFRFIRLCVSPEVIYRDGAINKRNLPYLDQGIERLENAGMAVFLDLHDNGQMKLDSPGHDNSGFVKFWEAMARHYKGQQTTSLVFELLNEPIFQQNPDVWYKLQAQTVDAIRAIDPTRTIMVASTMWNGIDTLAKMVPLKPKNLLYSVHCYDPFVFTHQGASWAGDQQKALRDIPFPSSPESVATILDKIPQQYRAIVQDYGNHRFDFNYIHDRLGLAATWGVQNHVPIVLGEFGAYPPVSPPDSRGRWFDAIHNAILSYRLPNAVWGYDDALGLGRTKSPEGSVHLDSVTLEHLYKYFLKI